MELPQNNKCYKEQSYWDDRFEEEDSYDWFIKYDKIQSFVEANFKAKDKSKLKILILGCGNSTMSAEMYRDGYREIINVDYSPVVINKMRKKYESMESMKWEVMDITNMSFEDEAFDAVIEKGTLDSLLVTETDPWYMSQSGKDTMDTVLSQVSKILKDGGIFISVTFAQPHFRKPVYAKTKYHWSIEYQTFGETFHFFFYTMRKGSELSKDDMEMGMNFEKKQFAIITDVQYLSDSETEEEFFNNLIRSQMDSEDEADSSENFNAS